MSGEWSVVPIMAIEAETLQRYNKEVFYRSDKLPLGKYSVPQWEKMAEEVRESLTFIFDEVQDDPSREDTEKSNDHAGKIDLNNDEHLNIVNDVFATKMKFMNSSTSHVKDTQAHSSGYKPVSANPEIIQQVKDILRWSAITSPHSFLLSDGSLKMAYTDLTEGERVQWASSIIHQDLVQPCVHADPFSEDPSDETMLRIGSFGDQLCTKFDSAEKDRKEFMEDLPLRTGIKMVNELIRYSIRQRYFKSDFWDDSKPDSRELLTQRFSPLRGVSGAAHRSGY